MKSDKRKVVDGYKSSKIYVHRIVVKDWWFFGENDQVAIKIKIEKPQGKMETFDISSIEHFRDREPNIERILDPIYV